MHEAAAVFCRGLFFDRWAGGPGLPIYDPFFFDIGLLFLRFFPMGTLPDLYYKITGQ